MSNSAKDDDRPLPNRVREWRKRRGLTLKQLAPKAGMAFSHIANIERGERDLNEAVMERLALALEVPKADLLNPEDGGLSEKERELIRTYREIPESMRAAIDAVAEAQQPFRGFGEIINLPERKAG